MPYADPDVQRRYQNEWKKRRREEWLRDNGPCRRCGSNSNLQVDHIDATKKVSHRIWSWSDKKRLEELAKCQVLCRTCHTEKGMAAGERPTAQHGGPGMYQLHGCRCMACRAWKSESDKKYKRKQNRIGSGPAC